MLPVQINGRRLAEIQVPRGADEETIRARTLADPEVVARLHGLTVRKLIVVPDRIVNLVAS